ncbi:MAG: AMP-binding protein [Deltaproteobacteria bacterium]|nr:AMP-binding protein [Deltaproteobacteria bacterium]
MSFINTILNHFNAHPGKGFTVEVRGKDLTATSGAELLDLIERARGFMRNAGVKSGDRVALLAPNGTRWLASDLAVIAEGAITVPLYSRQQPRQLAAMLADCSPSLLIASDDKLESAIRESWTEPCRIVSYQELFAFQALNEPPFELGNDDPVTIIYTSGTSGEPKGVVLTSGNVDYMLVRVVAEIAKKTGDRGTDDRVFHYLPFCFAGSRIVLWSQMFRANPIMISTNLDNLVEEIKSANPNFFLNVPVLLERMRAAVGQRITATGGIGLTLYQKALAADARSLAGRLNIADKFWLKLAQSLVFSRIRRNIASNLEFLICGSALLAEETQRWFEMIGIPVYQVYGLTETMGIVTIDNPGAVKPGRVGCPIQGCEVRLTDEGELICRGPNLFAGYWNRPEATAQVLRDGWFYTGDQAEIDSEGNIKILGRLRDLLVPESGHNIAPEPLETKLVEASDAIQQAMVVGHGRPYLTAIVTGPVSDTELDSVMEKVNREVPHYQRIHKVYHAPEPFSAERDQLTAMQKLRRKAIEKYYEKEIQGMYQ